MALTPHESGILKDIKKGIDDNNKYLKRLVELKEEELSMAKSLMEQCNFKEASEDIGESGD